MTRLLIVHNEYRSAEPSGENQVVRNEAAALSGRGHDVRVWGPSSDEIAAFNTSQKVLLPATVVWSRKSRRDLARVIDEHRPELVHIHNTFPLISASILGLIRERDLPTVATVHNYRILCAGGSLHREGRVCHDCLPSSSVPGVRHGCYRASRLATAPVALANAMHRSQWEKLDALVTLSEPQRQIFVGAGFDPARVVVKPNFVPEAPGSGRAEPGDGFLYAGRLTETKGVTVLMQAWDRLAANGLQPSLTIVGSGPLDAEVRRFAAALGSVSVAGTVSPRDCHSYIRRSRAVLAPSTWEETFGLVVVEAMMFGRPAIASAIGSLPGLIRHGSSGLLVPPGDPAALAEAVATLHQERELADRLGGSARAAYEQGFREAPNLDILESIYERVLNRAFA